MSQTVTSNMKASNKKSTKPKLTHCNKPNYEKSSSSTKRSASQATQYANASIIHASIHSQYQAASTSGLPSAYAWPDASIVPSREDIDHDLFDLDLVKSSTENPPYSQTTRQDGAHCTTHEILIQQADNVESSGHGEVGMERWKAEDCGPWIAMSMTDGKEWRGSCTCASKRMVDADLRRRM